MPSGTKVSFQQYFHLSGGLENAHHPFTEIFFKCHFFGGVSLSLPNMVPLYSDGSFPYLQAKFFGSLLLFDEFVVPAPTPCCVHYSVIL